MTLLVLGGLLFVGLCLASLSGQALSFFFEGNTRMIYLSQATTQAILGFILPAWLTLRLTGAGSPWKKLGISTSPRFLPLILMIAVMICAIPMLNEIIALNEGIHFPENLEKTFRMWEEEAGKFTDTILNTTTPGGLFAGIIIIGILTGFAEEIFFRGALQKLLIGPGMSPQGAVWLSALIFSLMHFQPFGFIPRMLLGAFFGYLYLWSGSIWLSSIAHAFNNSLVVITAWLALRGHDCSILEMTGTATDGTLWLSIASLLITAGGIVVCARVIPRNTNQRNGKDD